MAKVASRMPFDRKRQQTALTGLQDAARDHLGKDATELAVAVGLSYNQYLRYVHGKTPLRYDQFDAFARAYGVSLRELSDALGLLWDFRAELEQAAVDARQADEVYREYRNAPSDVQRAMVETLASANGRTLTPPTPRRAIAEERADYPELQTGT